MYKRRRGYADRNKYKGLWIIFAAVLAVVAVVVAAVAVKGKIDKKEKNTKDIVQATETDAVEVMVTERETETASGNLETTEAVEETTQQETTQQETTVPEYGNQEFVFEDTGDTKLAYLTFDDGPSENTYPILDILDQYGVKATFFTIGKTDETNIARYKEIVNRGHALGMHTYTHDYGQLYASLENFQNDVEQIHDWLYQVTGQDIRLYRFPGGSSNTVSNVDIQTLIDYVTSKGFLYYDWNVSSGDASSTPVSAEQMVQNVMTQADGYTRVMVLMHDTNVKTETVKALPGIIEGLQSMGYQIVPITDKTKPVQHRKASYME